MVLLGEENIVAGKGEVVGKGTDCVRCGKGYIKGKRKDFINGPGGRAKVEIGEREGVRNGID